MGQSKSSLTSEIDNDELQLQDNDNHRATVSVRPRLLRRRSSSYLLRWEGDGRDGRSTTTYTYSSVRVEGGEADAEGQAGQGGEEDAEPWISILHRKRFSVAKSRQRATRICDGAPMPTQSYCDVTTTSDSEPRSRNSATPEPESSSGVSHARVNSIQSKLHTDFERYVQKLITYGDNLSTPFIDIGSTPRFRGKQLGNTTILPLSPNSLGRNTQQQFSTVRQVGAPSPQVKPDLFKVVNPSPISSQSNPNHRDNPTFPLQLHNTSPTARVTPIASSTMSNSSIGLPSIYASSPPRPQSRARSFTMVPPPQPQGNYNMQNIASRPRTTANHSFPPAYRRSMTLRNDKVANNKPNAIGHHGGRSVRRSLSIPPVVEPVTAGFHQSFIVESASRNITRRPSFRQKRSAARIHPMPNRGSLTL